LITLREKLVRVLVALRVPLWSCAGQTNPAEMCDNNSQCADGIESSISSRSTARWISCLRQ